MYTTGAFEIGADFDPGPAVSHLSAVVNFDVFVLKMNPAGDFVWARNIGDSAADRGESIQLDDAGNIFVAGVYFITLNNGVKARTGRFVKG